MSLQESALEQIRQMAKRRLNRRRPSADFSPEDINEQSRLGDLDLDSLDLAELGNQLEVHLGIELTDEQSEAIFSAVTVSDILRAISEA